MASRRDGKTGHRRPFYPSALSAQLNMANVFSCEWVPEPINIAFSAPGNANHLTPLRSYHPVFYPVEALDVAFLVSRHKHMRLQRL